MPMTPDEAHKFFGPRFPALWDSVDKAFRDFFQINKDKLGALHARTKSSYINDLIVDNLKTIFSSQEAVWDYKQGKRLMWLLSGVVCMRVKKVNGNLQPHNLATYAQFEFFQALDQPQLRLPGPGFAAPTRLVLGYTTNPTKSAPKRLFIINFDGVLNLRGPRGIESIKPRVSWAIEISNEASQEAMLTRSLPQPAPTSGELGPRRVRTKDTTRKQKDSK